MNISEYQQRAQRTVSNSFHLANVPPGALAHILYRAKKEAHHVDVAKKSLFYGREPSGSTADIIAMQGYQVPAGYNTIDIHILHAILGIYTEAIELVELLYSSLISGEPPDPEDLINEAGDVMWYQALLFEALGMDFERVGAGNIAKLMARYPNKFTDKERDENAEKAAMMGAVK